MLVNINKNIQYPLSFSPKYPKQALGQDFDGSIPVREPTPTERKRFEPSILVVGRKDSCTVYRFLSGQGTGYMTSYEIYPGIMLSYNEFAMKDIPSNGRPYMDMIEINHCKEGRFECSAQDGKVSYLGKGDLAVHRRSFLPVRPSFPLGYYYGITVLIELPKIQPKLKRQLKDLDIELDKLPQLLNLDASPFYMRSTDKIEHIFSEMYDIQQEYRPTYLKMKLLELLYFIYHIPQGWLFDMRDAYIPCQQADIIKRVHAYLVDNIEQHITIKQLSKQFPLAETTLKTGFKTVYGASIGDYLRNYRIQVAAGRLSTGEASVTEVALSVGYENPSKFAAAFKTKTGRTPLEYQKQMLSGQASPCVRCALYGAARMSTACLEQYFAYME
jgi:AraC-like DNA-binding protein